jgi:branched-chain amino acid transport system substrate-binding protein
VNTIIGKCWVVGLLCLFAITPGCQSEKDLPVPPTIKVGALFPVSGELRDKGADSANGVRLAAEEINAAGGIKALNGAKLEIVFADSRGKPEIGVKETERLINQEGVVAVIGTYQSSVTRPATQVAERLRTPFIVSISIADIITERGFRYTFRIQPKAEFYARDQARFLREMEKLAGYPVKRVALLHENTDFGTSAALAQKIALKKHGLEVVADIAYQAQGATDLSREVAEALGAEPDVILTVTYLKDSILIRKALVHSAKAVPMLDTAGGTVSAEYVETLGPLADGTLTVAEYTKFAQGADNLNERFFNRFKTDITGDSAHAYQALLVLKDALERAGSLEKDGIREALSKTDIKKGPQLVLPAERLRFDKNGQNESARLFVVQLQKGVLIPVWPAPYARAKIEIHQKKSNDAKPNQ